MSEAIEKLLVNIMEGHDPRMAYIDVMAEQKKTADRITELETALKRIVEVHEVAERAAKYALEKDLVVEFAIRHHLENIAEAIKAAAPLIGKVKS